MLRRTASTACMKSICVVMASAMVTKVTAASSCTARSKYAFFGRRALLTDQRVGRLYTALEQALEHFRARTQRAVVGVEEEAVSDRHLTHGQITDTPQIARRQIRAMQQSAHLLQRRQIALQRAVDQDALQA